MTDLARVVIIGGGVMGASTLYHLTRLGWTDVVLLEKNDLTHGSTWHAAGLCTHFGHNATIMQMRAESIRLYSSVLAEQAGTEVGFRQTGAMRVTRLTDRMDEFRHVQGIGRFVGHEFHMLDPTEIKELYPLAVTQGLIGGIYEPHDGNVDPSQATHAFAAAARACGARIYRRSPVVAIEQRSEDEWRVVTNEREWRCEHIVNAAGTWCREIGEMMGVDLPVVPVLHQYFVTESIDEITARTAPLPIFRDPEESWYTRQEGNGLIFGPYEKSPETWSVDGVPPEFGAELLPPSYDRIAEIITAASDRIPALGRVGIRNNVNGPITFTPDANPLIGPAFGLQNAWLITGSSMGVMEGGGAGKFLAEWIVGGDPPMDPLAVDARRFGEYADRNYRVAKAVESFAHQFGIHYPKEERAAGRPARLTAFFQPLKAAGAVFGSVFGWERPNWFQISGSGSDTINSFQRTNWFEAVKFECHTVRERVGLFDMSPIAKFEVTGPGAEQFMECLGSNAPPRKDGRISLVHMLAKSGGVLSEFVVYRHSNNHYYLTCAAGAARVDFDLLRSRVAGYRVEIKPVTVDRAVLSVAGPAAPALLGELTDFDFSQHAFPWLSGAAFQIAGITCLALRVSYTGEIGWELHIPAANAMTVYAALLDAGAHYGLGHFGAYAVDSMRLEKGYRAWGMDLTTERTPLEAGLHHLIKTEQREFIGRDAMLRRQEAVDHWRMELMAIDAEGIDPFYLHAVHQGDQVVGIITSGAYGHRTGKALALAYLTKNAHIEDGGFEVELIGEKHPAVILGEPPYDPTNDLLRT